MALITFFFVAADIFCKRSYLCHLKHNCDLVEKDEGSIALYL